MACGYYVRYVTNFTNTLTVESVIAKLTLVLRKIIIHLAITSRTVVILFRYGPSFIITTYSFLGIEYVT